MGRRRKEPSLSDVLLDSPWWVSAALAVGAYIVFRGVLPAAFASNPFLAGIGSSNDVRILGAVVVHPREAAEQR
jgi:restriction system protein